MTVLARLADDLMSVQCDICVPPVLTINTAAGLRRTGWSMDEERELDCCPLCVTRVAPRHRVRRQDPAPVAPDPARLPNVIVVGATKAGTTSMHRYLAAHPDIAAAEDKELRFFQDPRCAEWVGVYQDQFAPGTPFRLDSTPFYSKSPCFPGVVERMAALVPDARIIYLVRDPVDRIVAEYLEMMQWNATCRSLDDELADPAESTSPLVSSSRYATQLSAYLEWFDAAQILVVDLDEVAADPAGAMCRILVFLGIDGPPLTSEEYRRFNVAENKRALPRWLMTIRRGPLGTMARRLPAAPRRYVVRLLWRRTGAPLERPVLGPETEAALRAELKPEVDRLRILTGQDFARWST